MSDRPWADPNHSGNKIRPNVHCIGCGVKGCITYWGPWCFECNVERMTRLSAVFDRLRDDLDKMDATP